MGKVILILFLALVMLIIGTIGILLILSDDGVGDYGDNPICWLDSKRECIRWTSGCDDCPVYRIIIEERKRNE